MLLFYQRQEKGEQSLVEVLSTKSVVSYNTRMEGNVLFNNVLDTFLIYSYKALDVYG